MWAAAPGTDWPALVAHAVAATVASGRGALVVVPDGKDVARVDAALAAVLGPDQHVVLTADAGPARRYRDFLAVSRGRRRVVVGTRAAAFAPVAGLGLVVIWDDGDDLLAEPRAPYPHARETLLLRAEREGTAALVGGSRHVSVEAEQLVRTGWAHLLAAPREVLRARVTVSVAGADEHALARDPLARATRVPTEAHHDHPRRAGERAGAGADAAQRLRRGAGLRAVPHARPVPGLLRAARPRLGHRAADLPLVRHGRPRAGPAPSAATAGCARRWWGRPAPPRSWAAPSPARVVRTSGGDRVLATVDDEPAIVVATPGAEPVAAGGYAAVVLLDTWLALGLAHLRAEEEALRRWANAVALVRPGGRAVVVGDPAHPAVQALVRWDPAGFAAREAGPAPRGPPPAGVPAGHDHRRARARSTTRSPCSTGPAGRRGAGAGPGRRRESRAVVRVPRAHGAELSRALGEVQRVRSARKLDAVRIQVDPPTLPRRAPTDFRAARSMPPSASSATRCCASARSRSSTSTRSCASSSRT